MRYPILTLSECKNYAKKMITDSESEGLVEPVWIGTGADIRLDRIRQASLEVGRLLDHKRESPDRDRVEGEAAQILFNALRPGGGEPAVASITVLDDPGFWRYLSIAHFWKFVMWRQPEAFKSDSYIKYIDGESSTECVLTRMYLRAAATGGGTQVRLCSLLSKTTDFWRSHILRVRTATASGLVQALVTQQSERRLATRDLRELAKAVNKTWTNVDLRVYNVHEAAQLLDELRLALKLDEDEG